MRSKFRELKAGATADGGAPKPHLLQLAVALKSFREDEDDEQTPLRGLGAAKSPKKSSRRYGVALVSDETVRERYQRRRRLCERRLRICDWSVYLALLGLSLAVLDVELRVAWENGRHVDVISSCLRATVIMLTLVLDILIVTYHWTEILSADTGHYTIDMTSRRRLKMCAELVVCSVCPYPSANALVDWPVLSEAVDSTRRAMIPLHVLLTVPMFFRLYLLGRYMVLHSMIIQDAATRAIASFNRVHVDFAFVLKTLICDRPLTFVLSVSVTFWACCSWVMTQCERYATGNSLTTMHYLTDYAWFEAVTFFAIGYGDLQVETYCGRSLAILTGIVGSVFSSLITVLVSRRMMLSLAEKRVNQVIAESQLVKEHKHAAAKVLQSTWRVVRWQRRLDKANSGKTTNFQLRMAQRKLLQSVLDFRRCRWKLRLRQEEEDDAITIRRAFNETEDRLRLLRLRQQQVGVHLQTLTSMVDHLSHVFVSTQRVNFQRNDAFINAGQR